MRARCLGDAAARYLRRMPRAPRLEVEDGIFHVATRSNIHRVAYGDDRDRALFLKVLESLLLRYGWECHAYCLMTTHYHLVIRTRRPTLATGMQLLNGHFARIFNCRRGERSHVFGGRYFSKQVTSEAQLIATLRYIALNPVAAGICKRATEWPWSSYSAWVTSGRRPSLLAAPLLNDLDDTRAVAWLRTVVEPVEGMAALAGSSSLNGARHS